MKVYMEVTKDEYELPVAIADSQTELAKMVGVRPSTVSISCDRRKKSKTGRRYRFICVEI